jgi:hypothetical protein
MQQEADNAAIEKKVLFPVFLVELNLLLEIIPLNKQPPHSQWQEQLVSPLNQYDVQTNSLQAVCRWHNGHYGPDTHRWLDRPHVLRRP